MKIRINELARELEIKPGKLLDVLPDLGIGDKKTHSSSLDDDVANAIRKHFGYEPVTTVPVYGGTGVFGSEARQTGESGPVDQSVVRTHAPPPRIVPPGVSVPPARIVPPPRTASPHPHASPVSGEDKAASPAADAGAVEPASSPVAPVVFGRPPLRPPL